MPPARCSARGGRIDLRRPSRETAASIARPGEAVVMHAAGVNFRNQPVRATHV